MITRLQIAGMGPHAQTDLTIPDPDGLAEISGPSESGKSLLIDAVCWTLWGVARDGRRLPDALIRADGEAMEARVTLASGKVFTRRRPAGGTDSIRVAIGDGDAIRLGSQKELSEVLKGAGDAELGRLILAPLAWRELATSAGGGRDLRAFLDRVLPGPTAADLLEADLVPGEPRTAKAAEDYRKAARKAHAAAEGALGEAQRALAASEAPPAEPDAEAVQMARETLERHTAAVRAFEAVASDLERWHRERDAFEARQRKIADRAAALKRLERPISDRPAVGALADADAEVERLQREESAAIGERTRLRTEARDLEIGASRIDAALAGLADPPPAEPCKGTRPGVCQIAARAEAIAAQVAAERARLTVERESAAGYLAALAPQLEAAEARVAQATSDLAAARERQRRLTNADRAWANYDRAVAALGAELEPLPEPGLEPVAMKPAPLPGGTRELIAAADGYPARLADHAAAVERARARVTELEAKVATAQAAAERAERVVELVRSAPGRSLAMKLSGMGAHLGPVSITVGDDSLDVLIDGRPWSLASTGRQIVADAWFRDALRQAADMPWLPIVIDEAQSVGGQHIYAPTPAWLLVTTDSAALEIRPWTGKVALLDEDTTGWPVELLMDVTDLTDSDGAWGVP